MLQYSPLIQQLIDAFRRLPGVGGKSAQRMVLHFLERDREGGRKLAQALLAAMDGVGQCERCRTLSETALCRICASPGRDHATLCVVETPADVMAVEQAAAYRGAYFVLMGHLSPIDGIGPEKLGIPALLQLVREQPVREVILATNPTVEGEATACTSLNNCASRHWQHAGSRSVALRMVCRWAASWNTSTAIP